MTFAHSDRHQAHSIGRRSFLQVAGAAALWGGFGMRPASSGAAEIDAAHDTLIVHTKVPMNAEPPLDDLIESWLTPTERFYVRSHAAPPQIDLSQFRLTVEGLVERPLRLSLDDLLRSESRTSTIATLTCAGNRRSEHSEVKPVDGVQWNAGAIGNARWSGVRLSQILKRAGIRDGARHVWFEGLDAIDRGDSTIPFGGSIPIEKALDDSQDAPGALLATHMNKERLTPDHGFPLRTVVPGYIGARSVKWLGKIVVSDRPSPNHYLTTAYKLVQQDTPLDWAEAGPIYRFPINAAICTPAAGKKIEAGKVSVAGYALPTGHKGATIARVDVSADGGQTWTRADLTSASRTFCWQLWKADVPVSSSTNNLTVRATDSASHRQPMHVDWNMKGYLFNAAHRVPIEVAG